jgi:D-alanyl-D-alanine carboxypeptidase/D-alanyl-D-alanine-endopeptidase (penicillin-binding protein 4)
MRTSRQRRWSGWGLAVLLAGGAAADELSLVWHAETLAGEVVSSRHGDRPVNPASVTKIATALLALETLGPEHRYETGFALEGDLDTAAGALAGDLVVIGGADPDFQFESALLVGWRLNALGVSSVTGDLVIDDDFWIGWEHGSERRIGDAAGRRHEMGARLRSALDPGRWGDEHRRNWDNWRKRSPELASEPPCVRISGAVRAASGEAPPPTVIYRSNPLRVILKRFLSYSNNDIERIADPLGGAPALERFLSERLGVARSALRLATSSGLGINRVAPETVVRLLRLFHERTAAEGLDPGDLLPMPGCDPGSLERALPRWQTRPRQGAMASKTGTLIRDDGGVATLAGFLYGREGTVLFMVAAPRSGPRILEAQRDIEAWTDDLVSRVSGPDARPCGAPVLAVDFAAEVLSFAPASPAVAGTGG